MITKRRIFSEIQLSTIPTKQSQQLSWPPLAAGRGKWLPVWRSLQYSSKLITVPSKVYRSGSAAIEDTLSVANRLGYWGI